MSVRVSFCCNDDRGNFAEVVREIQVGDEIKIVCSKERYPTMRLIPPDMVRVGRRAYECGQWASWVGNIYWDGTTMLLADAHALVRDLIASGWTVEEWADDSVFADLVPR